MGREYTRFIDGICAAVSQAISQWMAIASVVSALPAGLAAMVMPGGVTGPVLKPMILTRAPRQGRQEQKYSMAVATAVSDGWANWQQELTGVLTYAALYAPPAPNIPTPLISFSSAAEVTLSPGPLANAMHRALNDSEAMHATVLIRQPGQVFLHPVFNLQSRYPDHGRPHGAADPRHRADPGEFRLTMQLNHNTVFDLQALPLYAVSGHQLTVIIKGTFYFDGTPLHYPDPHRPLPTSPMMTRPATCAMNPTSSPSSPIPTWSWSAAPMRRKANRSLIWM